MHRVEERFVRVGGGDRGLDVVVHALHDVGGQQPFDDDGTVAVDRLVHRVDVGINAKVFHRAHRRRA